MSQSLRVAYFGLVSETVSHSSLSDHNYITTGHYANVSVGYDGQSDQTVDQTPDQTNTILSFQIIIVTVSKGSILWPCVRDRQPFFTQ